MKNRIVGTIIIIIAIFIGLIIYLFNRALTEIVSSSCTHGPSCPMWGSIEFQTNISLIILIFVLGIGIYLFFKQEETIVKIKKIKTKNEKSIKKEDYQNILSQLKNEEKNIFQIIVNEGGGIFQSDLVEKSNLSKVKVSRILDKLEAKNLIERKRRGMTNFVVIKTETSFKK